MKKVLFSFLVLGSIMMCQPTANAQIQTPAPSPTAEMKTRVGLTDVTLVYSRPSMKGRTIFAADGLVPFGSVWRTGANSATKLSFSDAVKLGGQALKAGDYALLTKPDANEWTVMVFPYESTNWAGYPEKTPAATFTVKPEKLGNRVESFTMDINNYSNDGAHIELMWDMTKVSLPLSVEVDGKVMAAIDRMMAGPSANDLYAAASYMHDTGKDLNKALEYVQKANAMSPQFWTLRRESLILADMGKKAEAINVAKKSLEMAEKAKNDDYVRMNKASIAEWSKK